jgi:hypothetical protein
MEQILAERQPGSDFRLSHYFDLVGGTSTGAIIAAGLALGTSVAHLIELYLTLAHQGFRQRRWIGGSFAPKFREEDLRAAMTELFGMETLGSPKLQCGLAIVAKRLDTGRVWLFHNHPEGRYFGGNAQQTFTPNKDLLLTTILRASTAAPNYFGPEFIQVSPEVRGLFVDGGVSPYNNPALLLLRLATVRGYGFKWPLGEDRMLLTSVGTGSPESKPKWAMHTSLPPFFMAVESLMSMMQDSNLATQTMLQWMSASPTPWSIDSEVGDLGDDHVAGIPLLHYLRYDVPLTSKRLAELDYAVNDAELEMLKQMDRPDAAPRLLDIGRRAAEGCIRPEHFPARFDERPASGAVTAQG